MVFVSETDWDATDGYYAAGIEVDVINTSAGNSLAHAGLGPGAARGCRTSEPWADLPAHAAGETKLAGVGNRCS